eukprot:CAMPEP_0113908926 /NCGR_PEP_ID=MMETSP0780_2-20120614/26493_1 /TAXON_ID=652834 /ORGANISM="Palpitomonas bilix" /LENGTH=113 /DNA_ID=CAMNT_0000904529 /DNA_START=1254 /DNA_END=1595 /DNA_ORIENTATION=+ /assembly_acc=CAM_ASM_000599
MVMKPLFGRGTGITNVGVIVPLSIILWYGALRNTSPNASSFSLWYSDHTLAASDGGSFRKSGSFTMSLSFFGSAQEVELMFTFCVKKPARAGANLGALWALTVAARGVAFFTT